MPTSKHFTGTNIHKSILALLKYFAPLAFLFERPPKNKPQVNLGYKYHLHMTVYYMQIHKRKKMENVITKHAKNKLIF